RNSTWREEGCGVLASTQRPALWRRRPTGGEIANLQPALHSQAPPRIVMHLGLDVGERAQGMVFWHPDKSRHKPYPTPDTRRILAFHVGGVRVEGEAAERIREGAQR